MMIKTYATKMNAILVIVYLLIISVQVDAGEWLTQLYAGGGLTKKHNAHVNLPQAGITATHQRLSFDSSALLGFRQSYWFIPFMGIGLDVSHFFGPDQKKQVSSTVLCIDGEGCSTSDELIQKFNNNVTTIGPNIVFGYPLNILQLQILPYVGGGPTLFIAQLRDTSNFIPARQSSTSTSVGLKAYGGLNMRFNKRFGAFVEYQYNSFPVNTCYYNERVVNDITLGKTQGKETFIIHSIIVGVSFDISTLFSYFP